MNSFFKGTLLLVLAAFFSECIEFLVNMVLAKQLGEEGIGLYMSILPVMFLVVILASLELPISISKFIAEKEQEYHLSLLKHATVLAVIATVALTIIAAVILPFIPIFDEYHPLARWLFILLIPIIAFSSLARGYFMGLHHMGKIAFSNFLRKIVQLSLLVGIYQLFHFERDTALLIALGTLVATEFVVFIYLIQAYFIKVRSSRKLPRQHVGVKEARMSILSVSVPTTALRIFHAMSHAVQPFLIKAALVSAGVTGTLATEQFGLLAGVAMTIGFFPAFIAHSLLIVLIPTVSEAYSKRDIARLNKLLVQVMLLTLAYGVPAVAICYFFAQPLTSLFFESTTAAMYLKLLWPYFLFHFFVIPMQAFLIGLGLIKDAFIHTVWSTIYSFLIMFILGSMHQFQMQGIIIGMNAGVVLLSLMHYMTICKKIDIPLTLRKRTLTPTALKR